jgi:predicted metal-dependent hydrolase
LAGDGTVTGRLLRRRSPATELRRVSVDLDGVRTELQVRRHPRARRISLRLSTDGDSVILALPRNRRLEEGLAVARAHASWIRARLDNQAPRIAFADGAEIPVNGRPLIITVVPQGLRGPQIDGGHLRIGGSSATLDQRVRAFLRAEARRIVLSRIAEKLHRLPRPPAAVSVRDTRSRWGSCSQAGRLSFCWRLILAPPPILDYVVAHELAHLTHRGHGPAFWNAVDALCSDVAAKRAWLRQHGRELFRYG